MGLIELLIVLILVFWVVGWAPWGPTPAWSGSWIHVLLVLVVLLILLRVLGVI
jgi:hypothetical protein